MKNGANNSTIKKRHLHAVRPREDSRPNSVSDEFGHYDIDGATLGKKGVIVNGDRLSEIKPQVENNFLYKLKLWLSRLFGVPKKPRSKKAV